RLALLRRRVGGRTHVSLVAGLLRENVSDAQTTHAADYLRLVGREGAADFAAILADERDRRVRARMCHVLAKLGPPIIPVVRPMLEDSRWYAVRNILYVLGKIGHHSAFPSVVPLLGHPDARGRVRGVGGV